VRRYAARIWAARGLRRRIAPYRGQRHYPHILSVAQAARLMGVSEDTVKADIRAGILPAVRHAGPRGRITISRHQVLRLHAAGNAGGAR
jgi:excisionase family DNA binding protein